MSDEEFDQQKSGAIHPKKIVDEERFLQSTNSLKNAPSIDWREKGAVNPIKD